VTAAREAGLGTSTLSPVFWVIENRKPPIAGERSASGVARIEQRVDAVGERGGGREQGNRCGQEDDGVEA
jgi:hypothetical protein